jgi:hypothetical protein
MCHLGRSNHGPYGVPKVTKNVSVQQPLSTGASPSPLSSRLPRRAVGAKPRDLQFRGPFLGMFFDRARSGGSCR